MVQRNLFLKFIIFWYWYQWKEVECFFLQISMKVSVFFQKGKVSFPQALIKVSIYNYQQQKYKRKQKAQFWQLMFTWSLWYVLIMPLFELIIIINICFLSEKLQFFFYNAIITKWNIWTINIFFGNTKGLFGITKWNIFTSGLISTWRSAERFFAKFFCFLFDNTSWCYLVFVSIFIPYSLSFTFIVHCDWTWLRVVLLAYCAYLLLFRTLIS